MHGCPHLAGSDPAGSVAFARDYDRQGLGGCGERRGGGEENAETARA